MDLISSLEKVLENSNSAQENKVTKGRSTYLSDQGRNDMAIKMEKLQEELTSFDS